MGDTNKKLTADMKMSAMDYLKQLSQAVGADADSDSDVMQRVTNLEEQVNKIMSTQRDVLTMLRLIAVTLGVKTELQIQFEGEQAMTPGQMSDTQTIQATAIETDAAGNPVTIDPANAAWGIDDSSIASLTQNPDGSATFKALKPGTATISLTDKATGAAGTNTLSVTSAGPNTLTISFGDPQQPTPPAPEPAPTPAGQ
jgi:hypothetical protein